MNRSILSYNNAGNYERITENGVTKEMYYIGDAIFVKQAGQAGKMLYTHKDHLGSIISITDSLGIPVFRATYDPWGKQTLNPANTFSFHRGYTGHEHLPEFELINMNARLYDPALGRMLQPDIYVQNPFHTQDYNRYSYALNNPFIYVDPTGMLRDKEEEEYIWELDMPEVVITGKKGGGGGFYIIYITITSWGGGDDFNFPSDGGSGSGGRGGAGTLDAAYTAAGALAQLSDATFRLTNSKGMFDWRWYGNGWLGNQYVTPRSVANLGRNISGGASILGGISLISNGIQTYNGNMSLQQFGYNALTIGAAEGVGLAAGGPAGVMVGATFTWYQTFYNQVLKPMYSGYCNWMESFKNPSKFGFY